MKLAPFALFGSLSLILAACGGGGASGAPAGGVPASKPSSAAAAPAKPSAAAVSPSASASAGGAPASAAVAGQKAPGPYTANGSVTATGGQAAIEATDSLKWQPDTIMAKPGDKVTLAVKNAGNTAHTFISPGLGVDKQEDVPIGKTTNVTFTAPSAPGAYQFWCNIPGHAEAGMVGEVVVQ